MNITLFYFLSLTAVSLFLYGFFPLHSSTSKENRHFNSLVKISDILQKSGVVKKFVLFVIDAFRYDFMDEPLGKEYLPFTHQMVQTKNACFIPTRAEAPTVTMPRLKALTTGTVPNYIDVLLNFGSPRLTQDNFLHHAKLKGLKMVFYGDETWLKLFPDTFIRHDGTGSFFASDYTEVDDNVTRHLDPEFQRSDWDIMILHYLGLDHIGHMEGPFSPLIKYKLQEMDAIIQMIHKNLLNWERSSGQKSLLVVTGDHGMKDSGSHGGVSHAEVIVPLIAVGQPCFNMPGWPDVSLHVPSQIDFASTISVLLGLPLPLSNMGKLIPQLLNPLSEELALKLLYYNKKHLLVRHNPDNLEEWHYNDTDDLFRSWLFNKDKKTDASLSSRITTLYFHELSKMSVKLRRANTEFNVLLMFASCIILWMLLCKLLYDQIIRQTFTIPEHISQAVLLVGTLFHTLSYCASSFIEEEHQTWYFLFTSFVVAACIPKTTHDPANSATDEFMTKGTLPLTQQSQNPHAQLKTVVLWMSVALVHRVTRTLNQTGDKWASLPDIGDFLNTKEGQGWLCLAFLCALLGLLFICYLEDPSFLNTALCTIAVLSIFWYRVAVRNVDVPVFTFYPSSRGSIEVTMFWCVWILLSLRSVYLHLPFAVPWALLAALLYRPHNTFLVPLQILFSYVIRRSVPPSERRTRTLLHVWLGYLFFFYQGHSNSIASVDIASGYVGLNQYIPLYVGLLLTAHTFSTHIFSFILSPDTDMFVYSVTRFLPVTFYCSLVILQRHHLFIWSVFSPKLLFECSLTTIVFLLIVLTRVRYLTYSLRHHSKF